jgi:hypothetical protein
MELWRLVKQASTVAHSLGKHSTVIIDNLISLRKGSSQLITYCVLHSSAIIARSPTYEKLNK